MILDYGQPRRLYIMFMLSIIMAISFNKCKAFFFVRGSGSGEPSLDTKNIRMGRQETDVKEPDWDSLDPSSSGSSEDYERANTREKTNRAIVEDLEDRVTWSKSKASPEETEIEVTEAAPVDVTDAGATEAAPVDVTDAEVKADPVDVTDPVVTEAAPVEVTDAGVTEAAPVEVTDAGVTEAAPVEVTDAGVTEAAPVEVTDAGVTEAAPVEQTEPGVTEAVQVDVPTVPPQTPRKNNPRKEKEIETEPEPEHKCENYEVVNNYCQGEKELTDRILALELKFSEASNEGLRNAPSHFEEETSITDCEDAISVSGGGSGVYQIRPEGATKSHPVYCQKTPEGIYTYIQQRFDGSTSFYRNWVEYKKGFGIVSKTGNFYIGNELIHQITSQRQYTLQVDLTGFDNVTNFSRYFYFRLETENRDYKLRVYNASGTTSDLLTRHEGQRFSTFDHDNDRSPYNCATTQGQGGGWWYKSCFHCNLNGKYVDVNVGETAENKDGVYWSGETMKHAAMKIMRSFKD